MQGVGVLTTRASGKGSLPGAGGDRCAGHRAGHRADHRADRAALDVGSSRYVSRVSEAQAPAEYAAPAAPAEPAWGPTAWDLVMRFHQVHHTLHLSLDRALENEGVSFAQVQVMAQLGDRPNLHAGAIARLLGIRRQSAHALLAKLSAKGLVELMPRREGVRCAYLTDIGKTVAWRCMDALRPGVAPGAPTP